MVQIIIIYITKILVTTFRVSKSLMLFLLRNQLGIDWTELIPDGNHDWLNQRNMNYQQYAPIADEPLSAGVFPRNAMGVKTNRDAWVYGFNKNDTARKTSLMGLIITILNVNALTRLGWL